MVKSLIAKEQAKGIVKKYIEALEDEVDGLKSQLEEKENMLNLSKIAFVNAVGGNERDLREGMRDIITRYGREESMGGYSAEFLVNWCMQYWTFITHHFRKEVEIWKKEHTNK